MNNIEYKASSKKVKNICAVGIVVLFSAILSALLIPLGDIRNAYIILIVAIIGLVTLHLIKKAKNAYCPQCKIDLYNIISQAEQSKINIQHCPSCGAKIEI